MSASVPRKRERSSGAKNRGSLMAGMKICGCERSIRYSALVPHFECPAMKKSGTRAPTGTASTDDSVELVIAPEAHEVAVEVLARGEHLSLEAAAQLEHQLGVGLRRLGGHDVPPGGMERSVAKGLWRQRLDQGARRGGERVLAEHDRVERVVGAMRAHRPARHVGLGRADVDRRIDAEELEDLLHRPGVVGAEVVVDQHQYLLGGKALGVAAELLGVADVLGVEQKLRQARALGDVPAAAPIVLERERLAQVGLELDVPAHE